MADPEVLDAEMQQVAEAFGVAMEQVRRDHLISHVLGAISQDLPDRVIFFGGTALSRTYLPHGRLSEDIDLIAVGKRREVAVMLEDAIGARLARTHGHLTWEPAPSATRDPEPALLRADDGLNVRVQLLGGAGYAAWPTEAVDLHQRYSDAPRRGTCTTSTSSRVPASLRRRRVSSSYGTGFLVRRCRRPRTSGKRLPVRRGASSSAVRPG